MCLSTILNWIRNLEPNSYFLTKFLFSNHIRTVRIRISFQNTNSVQYCWYAHSIWFGHIHYAPNISNGHINNSELISYFGTKFVFWLYEFGSIIQIRFKNTNLNPKYQFGSKIRMQSKLYHFTNLVLKLRNFEWEYYVQTWTPVHRSPWPRIR